jgi:Tfp pilus assembly protein PilF
MARLARGEVQEARRMLEAAWKAEPDSVEVMRGLAQALDLAGEHLRALALLERAHSRAPAAPDPACDLAMLHLEHEQDRRAVEILTEVLGAHPEHPRAHLYMAMALAKSEPRQALGHVAKALQDPDPETRQQAEELHRVLAAETGTMGK